MNVPFLISALLLVQTAPAPLNVANEPSGKYFSFAQRLDQLVEMARLLGGIHHLHKICRPDDYLPDRFRDRMKEMVALEEPMEETKQKMIGAFNDGFRSAKTAYPTCSAAAEIELRRLGTEGSLRTRQLAEPFGSVEEFDYYSVSEQEDAD